MASGEVTVPQVDESKLPVGSVVMNTGRVSGVVQAGNPVDKSPFDAVDRVRLDNTLTRCTRLTGIKYTVYIGDLGADPAERAKELLASLPSPSGSALIAVSPNQRAIEIRSGSGVSQRLDNRVAQLGVSAAIASFQDGKLLDGIVSAIRVMTAAVHPTSA